MIYKRILVAVDGSATAKAGLEEAIRLAKDQGATLGLLHVVDEMSVFQWPDGAMSAGVTIEILKKGGEEIMEKIAASTRKKGLEPDTKVIESIGTRVADVVVAHAKRWKADLIVMGTHGRRGINRMFMGSDAELTVRNSPVPVLLVRAGGTGKK
jgi:nucleotide-binding universal stress UspA family protein